MSRKNKCFIVMPVTTPADLVDKYSGDKDHFKHVLEHLFIPAIDIAGFEPVPPISKGSEVIHADIIQNIEKCDFLLCDMSILNPNVFFELGIRTAINKPVALVKDDITHNIPFDTHIINNHTYLNTLQPWELEKEIEKLTTHLNNCFSGENNDNSLWKYFSLSANTETLKPDSDGNNKIDYLTMQINALRQELNDSKHSINEGKPVTLVSKTIRMQQFYRVLESMAKAYDFDISSLDYEGDTVTIQLDKDRPIPTKIAPLVTTLALENGFDIRLI